MTRLKLFVRPARLVMAAVVLFVVCMVLNPAAVFEAAKTGLSAWWNIVFPALLPFFISSELLTGYGVIRFMGVLLEPVMRPLFNLPGAASFVLAVGFTSGFPISASLAAGLRQEGLCTRMEAERLMSFTNNASPLFMLVAVGVGMFDNARLGVLIALCHYAANVVIGLLLRFYGQADPEFTPHLRRNSSLWRRALAEMQQACRANSRPFSHLLADAVSSSVSKLMVIGGFVIIFAVIIRLARIYGIMNLVTGTIGFLAYPCGFADSTVQALGSGFFEVTLGTKAASEACAPLVQRIVATGMLLGWSGLSVLAQVSAMISKTDLKMGLFIFCRVGHAVLAGIMTYLALQNAHVRLWLAEPAVAIQAAAIDHSWLSTLGRFTVLCLAAILVWSLAGLLSYLTRSFSFIRLSIKK